MRTGLLLTALGLAAAAATAEPRWRFELAAGAARSFGSTLRLEQQGFPDLELGADWATRSFEGPLYYALRLARSDSRGAWAARLVHHKLHLENPTAEVERFAVSHGYNLLTLERAWSARSFELTVALGVVIAHPESTVRGLAWTESGGSLGGGYFVTGPTAAVAAARPFALGARVALRPELRFTLSRARVPIASGEAGVPNAALHLTLGLEARF